MNSKALLVITGLVVACVIMCSSCSVVTAPVEVATDVVTTGVKAITYPVRKAVD